MHVCCTYSRYSHSTAPKVLVFKLKRPFSRKPPAAIVGYFTMDKQSGNSCSSPYFAPPKRRVCYEAIAL